MGWLTHIDSERRHTLRVRQIVGRAPESSLCLPDHSVSGQHAALTWSGSEWVVRDLGSRNGTLVDGQRLAPGTNRALAAGASLTFGTAGQVWRLENAGAPVTLARPVHGGEPVFAEAGVLQLDDLGQAFVDGDGQWVLEHAGASAPLQHGQAVTLGGRTWVFDLVHTLPGTADAAKGGENTLALHFRVTADQEYIELHAIAQDVVHDLGARASNELLWVLAQRRADDCANPELPDSAQGWVHGVELERMLGGDANRINVDVFRARKLLAQVSAVAASTVVERRSPNRLIRLGIGRVSFETI